MSCLSERWACYNPKPGSLPVIILILSKSDEAKFGDPIYPTSMLFANKFGAYTTLTCMKTYYSNKDHSFSFMQYSY